MRTWLLILCLGVLVCQLGCDEKKPNLADECSAEADCPSGQSCVDGLCVATCSVDADCAEGELCIDSLCSSVCKSNADCPEGQLCIDGSCGLYELPGVANAGNDTAAGESELVYLDAIQSTIVEPDTVAYSWEQVSSEPSGIVVELIDDKADAIASSRVRFTTPRVVADSVLLFQLTIEDSAGNQATDEIQVQVLNTINEAPEVTLLLDQLEGVPGDTIVATAGESLDPNGDAITFSWDTGGFNVDLEEWAAVSDGSAVTFVSPVVAEAKDIILFVTVSDGTDETTESIVYTARPASEGATCDPPCDDGDACTDDACNDGECVYVPKAASTCDDQNECTDDTCEPATGCVHTDNTIVCDDHNVCTEDDVCGQGVCQGTLKSCNDFNPCTTDFCDPETDCQSTENTASCSDGDPCTAGDTCSGGTCQPGEPLNCDDGNPCTDDDCEAGTGCTFTPNSATCEDDDLCTGTGKCVGGTCQVSTTVCKDDGDPCIQDVCDPATGECGIALPDGASCDDGDPCTTFDTCGEKGCDATFQGTCTDPDYNVMCYAYGDVGDTMLCDIRVARAKESEPPPTDLGFLVEFSTSLTLVGAQVDGKALEFPGATLPTGHSFNIDPPIPEFWVSPQPVAIASPAAGPANLSEAYLVGSAVIGDPVIATLVFELKEAIEPPKVDWIEIDTTSASSGLTPLSHQVDDALIFTSAILPQ